MKECIVTVYPRFVSKGGAQDMAISIAKGLANGGEAIVMYNNPEICEAYLKEEVKFVKMTLPLIRHYYRKGAVFLSHHRKTTTFLKLLSFTVFRNKLRIVHVAHNTFNTLRRTTFLPTHIIAVSKTVKNNLIEYFKIPENRISIIYNGIKDHFNGVQNKEFDADKIKILFLGRIVPVKRQIEFVNQTKGKLNKKIKIFFAGIGEDFEELITLTNNSLQYIPLGLINIYHDLYDYDFVCLFSEKEGLPLSLIEGCMFAKPLLTNNIPSSMEVNHPSFNGLSSHTWDGIINMINSLVEMKKEEYSRLSENSRKLFNKKFDYNVMIDRYRTYLDSIIW